MLCGKQEISREWHELGYKTRKTSVKPGRGPSFMSGVASVIAALFGLFWFFAARSMFSGVSGTLGIDSGPAGIFPYLGLLFAALAIASAVYNFRNATGENRHSLIDVVDSEDEPDPLDSQFEVEHRSPDPTRRTNHKPVRYCPYCGQVVDGQFKFCPNCGKQL